VRNGLDIKVVPTSKETAELAAAEGINLVELSPIEKINLTTDGADEVDSKFNLIKGGGGALLREKRGEVFITDNNNYIIDCKFGEIKHSEILTKKLNQIPGVVENGLFVDIAELIIVGFEDGEIIKYKK
jgi:ribose 5-phosphate isomerase A